MAGLEAHYSARDIEARILAAVRAAGLNPEQRVSAEALGAPDHFHTGGPRASRELMELAQIRADERVLDIGAQTDLSDLAEKSSAMRAQIGDPKTDRAAWKRVNPLGNADRVDVSILLAYGASDLRVPLEHGTDFRAALDKYHKPYEWVVYANERHGFTRDVDLFDFYGRVERFLARYLGGYAAPDKPDAPAQVH